MVTRQRHLTPAEHDRIRSWDEGAVTYRWTEMLLEGILANHLNPVRAARAIAILTVAMYDATVACWDAKRAYDVPSQAERNRAIKPLVVAPDGPSFPSEHAAVAAAAAAVFSYLFPDNRAAFDESAEEAGESRIAAGVSTPSDVAAGSAIGAAVGALVVEHARSDNADCVFLGTLPAGAGVWAPSWPKMVEPTAGLWRPWVLSSASDVSAPPPPVYGSAEYLAEVDEIINVLANLTEEQRAIASFWADGGGTITPPGHWTRDASALVNQRFRHDALRATRALALLGVAMADAFISCWQTKFTYWTARPDQVINAYPFVDGYIPLPPPWGLSPPLAPRYLPSHGFASSVRTPPFPGYTSGHSTVSGAASEVLAYLFPDLADSFRARAEEAAVSRLYAGIHFSSDNLQGLAVGREIGRRVVEHVRQDAREN